MVHILTEYLASAVAGQIVEVERDKRDHYARIVGKVLLTVEDMNLRQVEGGSHGTTRSTQASSPMRIGDCMPMRKPMPGTRGVVCGWSHPRYRRGSGEGVYVKYQTLIERVRPPAVIRNSSRSCMHHGLSESMVPIIASMGQRPESVR